MRAALVAARHLPLDFKRIARLDMLRFIWLVFTYGLQWVVFNVDETGIRVLPLNLGQEECEPSRNHIPG
jgi:hypothetical protein